MDNNNFITVYSSGRSDLTSLGRKKDRVHGSLSNKIDDRLGFIQISHVKDPRVLYIQMETQLHILEKMNEDLENFVTSQSPMPLNDIQSGMVSIARISSKEAKIKCYRVVIQSPPKSKVVQVSMIINYH